MSSIKCPQCGLVNWATQGSCKRCGSPVGGAPAEFQTAYSTGSYTAPPTSGGYTNYSQGYQPYYTPQPVNQKQGMAIASLVLSLIGCGTAPLGLIFGIIAYKKAKRFPMEYGGKGFAIAGIAISSVMMFLFVPIIAAISIPNLMAARRAANEGSAISTLRTIATAEMRFMVQQRNECADLSELHAVNYIDATVASGQKSGYKFSVVKNSDNTCELHAVPISRSTGTRSFYLSSYEGVIRGGNKIGLKAGPDDPALGSDRSDLRD
jgi:hypothetical protein